MVKVSIKKARLIKLYLLLFIMASPTFVYGQSKTYEAARGSIHAVVLIIHKRGSARQVSRVEIRRANGRLLRRKSFASADRDRGQEVNKGMWSNDSRFFIFNADNLGGHQPWHHPIYFYDRQINRFFALNNFVGPSTSDFTLDGQNTVKLARLNFEKGEQQELITVNLDNIRKEKD